MAAMERQFTILCVVDRRRNELSRALRGAGHIVIESFTLDQAVAIAVNNRVDFAVLDRHTFIETNGWSVAQSLKLVRPTVCVLLVTRALRLHDPLPRGVDAIVRDGNPASVLGKIEELAAA